MNAETITALADALGVSVDFLTGRVKEENIMRIWRVTPQDPTTSLWKQNISIPTVTVRAPTVRAAQLLGLTALEDYLEEVPQGVTQWKYHGWVACEHLVYSNYSTMGEPEILDLER
jgi:hypothetical protein